MTLRARLDQTIFQLQQRDENEACLFNAEVERVFNRIGFPISSFVFLEVLDDRPWRDYHNSSSNDYIRAGREVLEKVMQSCRQQRQGGKVDPIPDNCLRKFEEYANSGMYEDFAVAVQSLVIGLDDLITAFPNRQRHDTEMDQDKSINDQIADIARFVTGHIFPVAKEIETTKANYAQVSHDLQSFKNDNWKKLEETHRMSRQDYCKRVQQNHEETMQTLRDKLKKFKEQFVKKTYEICVELESGIKIIIQEIDIFRHKLKQDRVNQLKPEWPPVECLNDLNRRCCEMFEFLQKLEKINDSHVDNSEVKSRLWHLQCELVKNVFVVELPPAPVLKLESKPGAGRDEPEKETGKKGKGKREKPVKSESKHESKFFTIGIRVLGAASCVDLQVAADQLRFTAHIERDHIEQAMVSMKPVDPSLCYCQVNVGKKKVDGNVLHARSDFKRTFDKMKLVKVPKPEEGFRQNHENVTDMKCAIVMSVPVGKVGWIKVLCEPIVLTTATIQTGAALGTIFWDAAFSQLKRNSYEEKNEVLWPELSEEIQKLFNGYIPDKPLTEQQLRSIALHLFKEKDDVTYDNYMHQTVSRRLFMKQPKVEDSFWKWLFSCLNLIRKDPHDKNWEGLAEYWRKGFIVGFVTKTESEKIIKERPPGTFLIRLRDTGIEQSNRDCPRASLSVVYRKDDNTISHVSNKLKATDIQSLKLGNALHQLKNGNREEIKYLYPANQTFEEAFGDICEEGSADEGYAKLVSILVSHEKNLNAQVTMDTATATGVRRDGVAADPMNCESMNSAQYGVVVNGISSNAGGVTISSQTMPHGQMQYSTGGSVTSQYGGMFDEGYSGVYAVNTQGTDTLHQNLEAMQIQTTANQNIIGSPGAQSNTMSPASSVSSLNVQSPPQLPSYDALTGGSCRVVNQPFGHSSPQSIVRPRQSQSSISTAGSPANYNPQSPQNPISPHGATAPQYAMSPGNVISPPGIYTSPQSPQIPNSFQNVMSPQNAMSPQTQMPTSPENVMSPQNTLQTYNVANSPGIFDHQSQQNQGSLAAFQTQGIPHQYVQDPNNRPADYSNQLSHQMITENGSGQLRGQITEANQVLLGLDDLQNLNFEEMSVLTS